MDRVGYYVSKSGFTTTIFGEHMELHIRHYTSGTITFEDLQFALTFSEETKEFNPKAMVDELLMLSFCCGLITVEKQSRLVRLVREYRNKVAIIQIQSP